MSSLFLLSKKKLFEDMVEAVPSQMKILIADKYCLKLVSAVCKMTDMVEVNVSLIESLEKNRCPFNYMDALYFMAPTENSISLFLKDWEKKPIYAKAHLFFTDHVSDELFDKISKSKANEYIATFREIYMDFLTIEPRIFGQSYSVDLQDLYSSKPSFNVELLVKPIARSLSSLCITSKVIPMNIRYWQSSTSGTTTNQLAFKLAKHFQEAFYEFYSVAKPTDFQSATILLLDRSFDYLSPFLHDFSYQSIINDLLPIENGKKYRYSTSDGTEKLIYLDEEDQIYISLKHMHLAKCSQKLVADFNKFEAENKQAFGTDIAKMQEAVANMNENLNKKEKFGIHLGMATECNKQFSTMKIDQCALLEQDMSTGYDAEGDEMKPAALFNQLIALLQDPLITPERKTRLIAVYIISSGGIKEDELQKVISCANLPNPFNVAIKNLAKIGVKVAKLPNEKPPKKPKPQQQAEYDVSRFKSPLETVLTDLCDSRLSKEAFPLLPSIFPPSCVPAKKVGISLRASKPSWQHQTCSPFSPPTSSGQSNAQASSFQTQEFPGEKIIVYILGGMTYSEVKAVYSTCQKVKREIYAGSSKLITPNSFLSDLATIQ